MRYYFSGVRGAKEYQMLQTAGVAQMLVNQFDLGQLGGDRRAVVLDAPAYKIWKSAGGRNPVNVTLDEYLEVALTRGPFDFVVSFDVIGDPEATRRNWLETRRRGIDKQVRVIPVWHFDADESLLHAYADESEIFGIGGLADRMRGHDELMLRRLKKICKQFHARTHVFALSWMKALNHLQEHLYSADSSHWLAGARKGNVVWVNRRHARPHLAETHHSRLGVEMSREERCVESARAIRTFVEEMSGAVAQAGQNTAEAISGRGRKTRGRLRSAA